MHFSISQGGTLVSIQPPELAANCRNGIYVCCNGGGNHGNGNHGGECGYHLWYWLKPAPIPHHNYLMQDMRETIPHINGNGSHA